jgi:hypothetical protein
VGLFSSILEKLGFGHSAAATPAATSAATSPAPPIGVTPPAPAGSTPPPPVAVPVVDVVTRLDALAARSQEKLDWKVSIVDLLKLLGLDSSLPARRQLAVELNCPADKLSDSAQMNMWLHKTVLQKLASNGGNVPKELLG